MASTPNTRVTVTLAALVALLAALAAGALTTPGSAAAQEASAASCASGITLQPATRKARRGGWVRLNGRTCGAEAASVGGQVRIAQRKSKSRRWSVVAKAAADSSGRFSTCAPVRVPRGAGFATLRATAPSGQSKAVRVRVSKGGTKACKGGAQKPDDQAGTEAPNPNCQILPEGTAPGCTLINSDTASGSDPTASWGKIDCASASRHQFSSSGGDDHPRADGAPQGNGGFRELTAFDGDDVYGERCELGLNDHRTGPTALYREGQRRLTFASFRLPQGFPLGTSTWQVVMQMKQAQPSANGGGTPVIELDATGGEWVLYQSLSTGSSSDSRQLWSAPAQLDRWTRFAFDVTYSQDPGQGEITLYVDLNGDGDFADGGERSPTMHTYTLKRETSGGPSNDGLDPGDSIPSHLRAGIYHNPSIACPGGCSVDLDNVQVVKP